MEVKLSDVIAMEDIPFSARGAIQQVKQLDLEGSATLSHTITIDTYQFMLINACLVGGLEHFSPPARWGLLDFIRAAASSFRLLLLLLLLLLASSCRRTSTTAILAKCWLPDLNHGHPSPVLAAGPQPRPAPPSVGCRTSTTAIPAQCWLPDLNHHVKYNARDNMSDRMLEDMSDRMSDRYNVRYNVRHNVRRYVRYNVR